MKVIFVLFIVTSFALAGCVITPTRVVYVPVPYVPAQGTAQQAYVPPVYQTPMYLPRNPGYCPGHWCPRQQFGYRGYGGYGGGSYFFFHRHGRGGYWR